MELFEQKSQRTPGGAEDPKTTLEQEPVVETGLDLAFALTEAEADIIERGQEHAAKLLEQLRGGVTIEVGPEAAKQAIEALRSAYQLRPETRAKARQGETLNDEDLKHLEGYKAFLANVESTAVTARIDEDYVQAEAALRGPDEAATRRLFERVKSAFLGLVPVLAGLGAAPAFAGEAGGGSSQPIKIFGLPSILAGLGLAALGAFQYNNLGQNPPRHERRRWFMTGLLGVAIALGGPVADKTIDGLVRAVTSAVHPIYRAADAKAEAFAKAKEVEQEQAQTEKERVITRRPSDNLRAKIEGEAWQLQAEMDLGQTKTELTEAVLKEPKKVKIINVLAKIEKTNIEFKKIELQKGLSADEQKKETEARDNFQNGLDQLRTKFDRFQKLIFEDKKRGDERGEILGLVVELQAQANKLGGNGQKSIIIAELQDIFIRLIYL